MRDEETIFDEARVIVDKDARAAFLSEACEGDVRMRTRVEALLEAEAASEAFFEDGRTVLTKAGVTEQFINEIALPVAGGQPLGEEPLGSRVGRYKLIQKLGEGGCGVVYLAEQEEPVRRRVALKIIKLGMETRSVIARFEAERQALAMMDHPNIARVFDAGATERGSPYFVMELVSGVRITEYCDRNRLSIAQRLDLFIQTCQAIQHAHQKGIIHRDIKPSNIMVALQDGQPVPKVIDFGISKATEARLSDRVSATAFAQFIGTPAYMSPEQAEMSGLGLDIDTRSDIYSLGVLLYELITGRTPFDAVELQQAGIDGMRRILREREPPRPSTQLIVLSLEELGKVAEARQSDPAKLLVLLRGDLDWVVMRALEKDRRRRYETANGLALDIQRHLHFEPVMARPPSWLYQFQKLVRRNRVLFAAGGAVTLALIAGMGTSTWLFLKEREARQRAVAAEQQQARLRLEAESREKITQAALLVNQEKFAEADTFIAGIDFTHPTVEGAVVLRALGEWHLIEHRWRPAADRFVKLVQVNLFDGVDNATLDYLRAGPALIEVADQAGYQQFRRAAIVRFTGQACPHADRIVKVCLLQPADNETLAALGPLVVLAKQSIREAEVSGDLFQAAWRSLAPALLEYRLGHYEETIAWCRRCLACPEYNGPRVAVAHILLAMAYQQGGRVEEAQGELVAGREIVEDKFKTRLDLGTPVKGFWFDWVFARIVLREAVATLAERKPE